MSIFPRAIIVPLCLAISLLSACQTSEVLDSAQNEAADGTDQGATSSPAPATSAPAAASPAPVSAGSLEAKRCAVYYAIEDRLEAEGRPANGKIYEGCPGSTSVNANIRPATPTPQMNGTVAATLYRNLISRGTPKDVADDVAKSPAFAEWVAAAS